MNLDETLNYLGKLQVSERSEDESDIDILHQGCAKIYIQPPVDPFGDNSDVDSGNEEEPNTNNFSGNQLLAPASLEIKRLGKAKKLSITSEMFSSNYKSELPSSSSSSSSSSSLSSSSSGENRNPKQKKRSYEKDEPTYSSKDTGKPSNKKSKKECINVV